MTTLKYAGIDWSYRHSRHEPKIIVLIQLSSKLNESVAGERYQEQQLLTDHIFGSFLALDDF